MKNTRSSPPADGSRRESGSGLEADETVDSGLIGDRLEPDAGRLFQNASLKQLGRDV
jgi:hypothetical protein